MQIPPRTPPRFVPTLTEVVQHVPVSASTLAPPAQFSDDAGEQGRWPDADVPLPAVPDFSARPGPPEILATEALEDQIIHRVMQRVDLSLERRLQDAVSAMVLAQTQLLVPRLREEIEFVVRQSVSDAVADELATRSPR
ncbi:MAG: hypothetical protein JWP29_2363 [Rhodoferax sp.]|nr:hypothetical protein [Rhodoferax sp.]